MPERTDRNPFIFHLGAIFAGSLGLGALIQAVLRQGTFWLGFVSISLIIFVVGCVLYFAWKKAGAGKVLAWMMFLAFFLRVGYGVFLAWGLPRFGYEERPQQAGYVFEDAYRRDRNAWMLSRSGQPLTRAFSDDYEVDQYGGLLALSGFVYRYLSPDEHRPILVVFLAAGAMALSVPFLMLGLKRKVSTQAVLWAGWILTLYPEGILLGASQMREPFMILFFTLMFWAVSRWMDRKNDWVPVVVLVLSAMSLLLFSFRVALPMFGAVFLWIWAVKSATLPKRWMKILGWVLILTVVLMGLWFMRDWVDAVLHWDTLQTISRSGRVQFHLEGLPSWLHFPFIMTYGLLQPVLPAAIAAPAPWIWHSLAIFRALGWYVLFPLMAYALIRVWRLSPSDRRRFLLLFVIMVWAWVLIASARAGGDQWDNPRYRTLFLPWMAVVAGWGIAAAKQTRDRWLNRVFMIEGIFLLFFTQWYISRYNPVLPRLELGASVVLILILTLGVVVSGLLKDRKQRRESLTHNGKPL
jgi:hypothetical protein